MYDTVKTRLPSSCTIYSSPEEMLKYHGCCLEQAKALQVDLWQSSQWYYPRIGRRTDSLAVDIATCGVLFNAENAGTVESRHGSGKRRFFADDAERVFPIQALRDVQVQCTSTSGSGSGMPGVWDDLGLTRTKLLPWSHNYLSLCHGLANVPRLPRSYTTC